MEQDTITLKVLEKTHNKVTLETVSGNTFTFDPTKRLAIHGECSFLEKYFLLFLSFLRFLFSCPISFDGGVKRIKELKLNMSQLDSDKYYKVKDKF